MNDLLKIAVRKRRVSSINNHRVFYSFFQLMTSFAKQRGLKSKRRCAVAVLLPAALSFIATGFSFAAVVSKQLESSNIWMSGEKMTTIIQLKLGSPKIKAIKSSPLFGSFGASEFWGFSLLTIKIGWVLWCFKLQNTLLSSWLFSEVWYIIAPNLS